MLPSFPPVVLRDRRGLFVTLSHFCPTAAGTLFDPSPLRIVDAPATLTLDGLAEGLDATSVLPPLVRPGMLADADAHDAWEHAAVGALADDLAAPEGALARIRAATTALGPWTPASGSLSDAVAWAFRRHAADRSATPLDSRADATAWAATVATIPDGLESPTAVDDLDTRWPDVCRAWLAEAPAIRRYLAARLFGSWFAYDAGGLLAAVRGAEVAAALLRVELARPSASRLDTTRQQVTAAIRATDLLLVHLADHRALADFIERTA